MSLRAVLVVVPFAAVVSVLACTTGGADPSTSPETDDPGNANMPDPADPTGPSPSTPPGAPPSSTPAPPSTSPNGPTCTSSDDCPNWYCECASGPPVNSRHCTNGRCEDAPTACPRACKSFNTCWTGKAGGGWDGGSNAGPNDCTPPAKPPADAGTASCNDGTSYTDLGKACLNGSTCQSGQCWGVSPSFQCTKRCTSSDQCPKNWKCTPTANNFSVCMQGTLASGSLSSNAGCAQVSFTDLGGGCVTPTDCQSYICLSSTYCSKRCEVDADCPATWTCKTGQSFKFCVK